MEGRALSFGYSPASWECRSRRGGVAKLQLLHQIIAQRYVAAVGKYVELLHCRNGRDNVAPGNNST
ncbi:hypothetical protein [Caballeronia sp. LZ028]|uniref:hypothetical protein n=1 Tax=Caballeronia sp. LZ028 TaxID=3038563 RepID=UPI0028612C56|nr:hypothetical protein [Caballeronia sp. LZ028]MDR5769709.1 hypothetical protein [Caballeronia sp. LZ028]